MTRHILVLLAAVIFFAVPAHALEMPPGPSARVNDYARVLQPSEAAQLESRLAAFEQQTSNQVVIAIFPELGDEDVDDFTNRLFEKWRLGQKGLNNGVLIAAFIQDRRVRIEAGYGLEGVLTDSLSSEIIRNQIAPEFRNARYGAGLNAAVNAIEQVTRGEYRGKGPQQPAPKNNFSALIPILFFLFLIYLSHRRRRRGVFLPRSGYPRGCGFPIIFFPGGGGGWGRGGGSGWGGGGGGGGFSGGGGLSGGGGASGSW